MRLEEAEEFRRFEALERARKAVRRIERGDRGAHPRIPLGWPEADRVLDGGLRAGCLHEVAGGSAVALALRLLGRVSGSVLWCRPVRRTDVLYGPGLAAFGKDLTERLILVQVRSRTEGLWAVEEGLRSGTVGAVVLEPPESGALGLTASRRLHLAAGTGGALGLVLPGSVEMGALLAPGAAASRWRMDTLPSRNGGQPCWRLTLERRREGGEGSWVVEG